jgi:hypothetical protein
MAEQRTKAGTIQALPVLPPKRPQDTQTAWEDPWAAISPDAWKALEEQAGERGFRPDAHVVGRRITEEINLDPEEVRRLRKARQHARDGKTYPRHDDEKSS